MVLITKTLTEMHAWKRHSWIWLLPESLEKLRLTLEANKIPLDKWPGTLFGSLSREGIKVAFLKDGKEEP